MGFIQTGFSCVSVGTDLIEEKLVKFFPNKPEKQTKFRNPFIHQQDWCDKTIDLPADGSCFSEDEVEKLILRHL